MKTRLIFIFSLSIMAAACNPQKSKTPDKWSEKELSEWFSKGKWKQGWNALSDESVDQKKFARLYFENPERWNKAFQFLSEQNLSENIPVRKAVVKVRIN